MLIGNAQLGPDIVPVPFHREQGDAEQPRYFLAGQIMFDQIADVDFFRGQFKAAAGDFMPE